MGVTKGDTRSLDYSSYVAFNMTPIVDCEWVGAGPKLYLNVRKLQVGQPYVALTWS